MKKITVIIIAILLVILAVKLKDSFSITNATNPASTGLETRESSEGSVTVAVTPRSLKGSPRGEAGASWDFDITLDTHSEELNEDLVAVSELVDDHGKSYKPVSWEGAPPGGHHREGVLKFNPISPKPKTIELKIKNVGGIEERRFKWIF